jgi:ribose-phosphate pyrophosphokinase
MRDLTKRDVKHLMLFAGRSHPELSSEIAQLLGCDLVPTRFETYANSEVYLRFEQSVRGCDAFVIQAHVAPVNDWLMEQLIMVDALRRASAKRITVVCPFYPYARQDKKHAGREPISARLVADLYAAAGATRIMSVDLHAAQIQGFFSGPVDHLYGLPLLADYVESKYKLDDLVIVSPDAGRVKTADMWSDRLGSPIAIIHKRRDPDTAHTVKVHEVVGNVNGKTCLLVDDMIDTGGTICLAADALRQAGAARVIGAATHPVLSEDAINRLERSVFEEVIVTNTLPIPPEKRIDKLTILSIAPMVAEAIEAVFKEDSVAALLSSQHKWATRLIDSPASDRAAAQREAKVKKGKAKRSRHSRGQSRSQPPGSQFRPAAQPTDAPAQPTATATKGLEPTSTTDPKPTPQPDPQLTPIPTADPEPTASLTAAAI